MILVIHASPPISLLNYTNRFSLNQQKDYEKVYAFGIDFNYLLRNHKTIDTDLINNLCTVIEKKIKEQTDEGVDD